MPSNALNQINRLTKEIADLQLADSKETTKEAAALARINRAEDAIHRTKSRATAQSKQREIERVRNELARIQGKRAGFAKKIADKTKRRSTYESQHKREEDRDRKKETDEQKRLLRKRELHERAITREVTSRRHLALSPRGLGNGRVRHVASLDQAKDFFISHASEDKDSFVRHLAKSLEDGGASVWYDEYTLKVGDSLRQEIDRGLVNSTFGIVVLSPHFFAKQWPQRELDALFALDVQEGRRILPIWHQITKEEVLQHSPMLADKVALDTSLNTVDEIARQLLDLIGTS